MQRSVFAVRFDDGTWYTNKSIGFKGAQCKTDFQHAQIYASRAMAARAARQKIYQSPPKCAGDSPVYETSGRVVEFQLVPVIREG
jgi:hypothetical protein